MLIPCRSPQRLFERISVLIEPETLKPLSNTSMANELSAAMPLAIVSILPVMFIADIDFTRQ
jgi:hypothetical protein